jgi:hypothetical protein
MEKEFIPYEQALALKELGFEEPCLAYYDYYSKGVPLNIYESDDGCGQPAPLYQQAFRWFRNNHCFYNQIHKGYGWEGIIRNSVNGDIEWNDGTYNSPEEAELACLIKLIEIVK